MMLTYLRYRHNGHDIIIGPELYDKFSLEISSLYSNLKINEYLVCIVNVKDDTYEIEINRKSRGLIYTCMLTLFGLFPFTEVYLASNNEKMLCMILDLLRTGDGIKVSRIDLPLEKGKRRIIA